MTPHDEAFGIAKAYTPGTITYHHEQAGIHARKKSAATRRASLGAAGVGLSAAAAGAVDRHAPAIARHLVPPAAEVGSRAHGFALSGATGQIRRGARIGGVAGVVGSAAVAGQGALSALHHAGRQNRSARHAQQARLQRNRQVAKAAAGPDEPRDMTPGAGAGAGVGFVAGARAQRGINHGLWARHASSALDSARDAAAAPTRTDSMFHSIVAGDKMDTARKYAARAGSRGRAGAAGLVGAAAGAGIGVAATRGRSRRAVRKSAFGVEEGPVAKAMPFAGGARNLGAAAGQVVRRGSARRSTARALRPLGQQAPPISQLARRARFKGKIN